MLEAISLRKSFGAITVTDDVSLKLATGERRAVIGPNGAGKTSFFNLLTGELPADSGQVVIDGTDVTALSPDRRARLGLARSFQKNNLFRGLTVRESLTLAVSTARRATWIFWRNAGRDGAIRDAVDQVAQQTGLQDRLDQDADALPYGARRQLEVATALAAEPKILLMDAPTSGVSPEETGLLRDLILNLPRTLSVIVVEHDTDLVYDVADRVTVLDYGRVVFEGTPAEARDSALVREIYLGHWDTPGAPVEPAP